MPASCPDCGNSQWIYDGPGTERLEMFLNQHFDAPVLRIDRDTTAGRDSMAELVKEVNKGEPCILVGTQMLAKGHHFPAVTLVGIVDMDAGLFSADYRATENSAQLLLQVADVPDAQTGPAKYCCKLTAPLTCLTEPQPTRLSRLCRHSWQSGACSTCHPHLQCGDSLHAPQLHDAEQFLQRLRNSCSRLHPAGNSRPARAHGLPRGPLPRLTYSASQRAPHLASAVGSGL